MEQLFIQILGNSPTLIAVLMLYARFDKRCALLEKDLNDVKKEQEKCFFKL